MHGSARDLPFGKEVANELAIIEGRRYFFTQIFFKYKVGVDNGPIVDKRKFSINYFDSAETLHYKNEILQVPVLKI